MSLMTASKPRHRSGKGVDSTRAVLELINPVHESFMFNASLLFSVSFDQNYKEAAKNRQQTRISPDLTANPWYKLTET
jgi:hypothetical protein